MVPKGKKKKKANKSIKQELLDSLIESYDIEEQGLNETVNNINKSQEAIVIICRYEDIIKTQDTQDFFENVSQKKRLKLAL